jgi:hypothetical protein
MVRRRTGISSLGFPSFNVGGEGGIIPRLSLPSVSPQFPRPRGRPSAPASVDPFSAILPMIVPFISGAVGDAIDKQPTQPPVDITSEAFTELSPYEQAKTRADILYGPDDKQSRISQIVQTGIELIPLLSMSDPREISTYTNTLNTINTAKANRDTQKSLTKANFIASNSQISKTGYDNFVDADSAKSGIADYRVGYFQTNPNTNETSIMVLNDDRTGFVDSKELGRNYIKARSNVSSSFIKDLDDPLIKELDKADAELNERDAMLLGTLGVANEVIQEFDKAIANPALTPTSVVATIGNFVNSTTANVDQALAVVAANNEEAFGGRVFATDNDVRQGLAGSQGREGSGQLAKQLLEAIKSGDADAIEQASQNFDNSGVFDELGFQGKGIRDFLGDLAYSNVKTRSAMLQLAYAAAAANGQTGRTLSDKDLAFHLQMVGFGASQDPRVLRDNLINFIDRIVNQNNNQAQATYGVNRIFSRYRDGLEDRDYQNRFLGYYDVKDGNFTDQNAYTFKPFETRYKNTPDVITFLNYERRGASSTPNTVSDDKENGIRGFKVEDIEINPFRGM